MPARILIVDDDLVTTAWLKSVLEREGYATDIADSGNAALQKLARDLPDLVILDIILPDLDGLEVLSRLRADSRTSNLRVIVLTAKGRREDIVTGLRTGVDDYIPKRPGADVELLAKIRTLLAQPSPPPVPSPAPVVPPKPRGRLFSFCSAKGGAGTTSVCVNIGMALAQLEPRAEILIVDMVFPLGSVGQHIGYESRETVAKLSRVTKGKTPDRAVIEKYVSPLQRWNFRVLLSASDPQEATNIEVSQIVPLFETLQAMYDYVLVDFGRALSRISLPIIEMSDGIVVIVTPDISTVKLTKLTLDYLESLGVTRTQLILINNRTVGRVWISKEETERELRVPLAGTIPYELEYFTMAINAGIPFMAKFPDHAASLMFTDFARLLRDRAQK